MEWWWMDSPNFRPWIWNFRAWNFLGILLLLISSKTRDFTGNFRPWKVNFRAWNLANPSMTIPYPTFCLPNCTNKYKILKIDTFPRGRNAILWTKRFDGHLGVSDRWATSRDIHHHSIPHLLPAWQFFLILGPFRGGGGVKPNFADKNFLNLRWALTKQSRLNFLCRFWESVCDTIFENNFDHPHPPY